MKTIGDKVYVDVTRYAVIELERFDQMEDRLNSLGNYYRKARVISVTQHDEDNFPRRTIAVVEYIKEVGL